MNADDEGDKPVYPYCGYKITTPYVKDRYPAVVTSKVIPSADERYQDDVEKIYTTTPSTVISVTLYDRIDPWNLALRAREFFTIPELFQRTIDGIGVIEDVTSVQPRNSMLAVDLEKRWGFDVRIQWDDSYKIRDLTIENIELKEGI